MVANNDGYFDDFSDRFDGVDDYDGTIAGLPAEEYISKEYDRYMSLITDLEDPERTLAKDMAYELAVISGHIALLDEDISKYGAMYNMPQGTDPETRYYIIRMRPTQTARVNLSGARTKLLKDFKSLFPKRTVDKKKGDKDIIGDKFGLE